MQPVSGNHPAVRFAGRRACSAAVLGCVLGLLASVVLGPARADAAHADGGGGRVTCTGNPPVCTIGVGTPGKPGAPGSGGGSGGGGSGSSVCSNTDPMHGCDPCPLNGTEPADPAACDAFSQNLFCSELNPAGVPATPAQWEQFLKMVGCWYNAYVPPNPSVLAVQAAAELDLGVPSIDRSPSADLRYDGAAYSYARLATWFWTSSASWRTRSKTVTASNEAGSASATATATPTVLVFDPGTAAAAVSCAGPGEPWQTGDTNGPAPSGCSYTYPAPTSDLLTATVTIQWSVSWTGSFGMGGTLPMQTTSASQQLRVLQVATVVTR